MFRWVYKASFEHEYRDPVSDVLDYTLEISRTSFTKK